MLQPVLYPVSALVEGDTDETVVRRVLEYVGLECGTVYGKQGKDYILASLSKYNQAARFSPWRWRVDCTEVPRSRRS